MGPLPFQKSCSLHDIEEIPTPVLPERLTMLFFVFVCLFVCLFVRFFNRSCSALHRRSSTEILFRPLGHLLCRGSPNVRFSFLVAVGFEPTSLCIQCGRFTATLFCLEYGHFNWLCLCIELDVLKRYQILCYNV